MFHWSRWQCETSENAAEHGSPRFNGLFVEIAGRQNNNGGSWFSGSISHLFTEYRRAWERCVATGGSRHFGASWFIAKPPSRAHLPESRRSARTVFQSPGTYLWLLFNWRIVGPINEPESRMCIEQLVGIDEMIDCASFSIGWWRFWAGAFDEHRRELRIQSAHRNSYGRLLAVSVMEASSLLLIRNRYCVITLSPGPMFHC